MSVHIFGLRNNRISKVPYKTTYYNPTKKKTLKMLGGLYGDLPPPSSSAEEEKTASSSVWSSSTKMAPPTLRKPPSSVFAPPHTLLKPKTLIQPQPKTLISSHQILLEQNTNPNFPVVSHSLSSTVIDEYDPARPNDYEEFKREKKRLAAEAERKREIEKRRREEEEREREREKRERERREREEERERGGGGLNISGEEAWRRRQAMSSGGRQRSPSPPQEKEDSSGGFSIGKSGSAGLGLGAGGQMTAAQRMMAKMGWKEGQGLGKDEQGITAPLVAKKTDRRAGVIVNAGEVKKGKGAGGVRFEGTPTRVVLLRNMVGPGEVDDELEDEVASECSKYGTVTRVLIFEITAPNYPVEEAVRIFIQFQRSEEATKALVDLDGRFFGGRVVRAGFYDEGRFEQNELAPLPGEVAGF